MKRPIVWALLFLCVGILFGQYNLRIVLFFGVIMLGTCLCLFARYRYWPVFILLLAGLLGAFRITQRAMPQNPSVEQYVQAGETVILFGTIRDTAPTGSGGLKLIVRAQEIIADGHTPLRVSLGVNVYLRVGEHAEAGNIIRVEGKLLPLEPARNPGGYHEWRVQHAKKIDYKMFPERIQITGTKTSLTILLYALRNKLATVYDTVLPTREAAIVKSFVLGDVTGLDDEINELYRIAGVYHLLSISGLHIAVLLASVYFVLGRFMQQRTAGIFALFIMAAYCLLTGAGVPTVRAVAMCGVSVAGRLLFREYDITASACFACILLLLYEPLYLFNVGFQLSFGTVLGMAALTEPTVHALHLCRIPLSEKAAHALGANIAATMTSAPIINYHFANITPYSLIANIIILPTSTFLVIAGLLTGIVGLFWIEGAVFLSGGVYYLLRFYEAVCRFFAAMPFSLILTGSCGLLLGLIAFAVLVAFGYVFSGFGAVLQKRLPVLAAAGLLFLITAMLKAYPRDLSVTILDVGQGNAYVMQYQSHTFLVDGGGQAGKSLGVNVGTTVLSPYLDRLGVKRADAAFVTGDEVSRLTGLVELIRMGRIEKLYIPEHLVMTSDIARLLIATATEHDIPLVYVNNNDVIHCGALRITVLVPQDGRGMALWSVYGETSLLFTGGVQHTDQYALWQQEGISADITVLPNQRASLRGAAFLCTSDKTGAAIISLDSRNNHLVTETHEILRDMGIPLYSTGSDGAVIIHSNGKRITLYTTIRQ